ncbi:LysR family transcriptional regulator [Microvirga subterranea]|uniref:DNA-binding transcriptional LysR family regulator n=1 Tax=Microvirga subterranea TaxID=186651 RepID=A0A370HNN8_9HYPH|nr:LysR family transcriptional regulator [Microvirga subterranea]RDI59591.1 DNA-binding transcriptional LysR family regulator [Microvirga subterranea]
MLESLRDIRLFVAVYEERSFTAAALRENATQSGVSQHIRKIEGRFGVKLFARGSGGVMPTPAGDSYYRHCIDVLRSNEAATRALLDFSSGLEGEITVGLMPTMTRCAMAPALARFMDMHPNVVVRITEAYSAVLTQQVRAGELDFAIVPAFADAVGLKSRLLARTPEVLVSNGHLDVPHMKPVRLADLGTLKVVVPSGQNTRRRSLETYFSSNGVRIGRVLELDAMLGTLDLVAGSDWVTILPGVMMANDIQTRHYVINPLAQPPLETDLVLIEPARQPLSPAAETFLAVLEEETTRLNELWNDPTTTREPVGA